MIRETGLLRVANMSNGLAFPHDDICYFQSNYGHKAELGYFRVDAMPPRVIVHLLGGGSIEILDGTRRHKPMTDAQKFGVPTWLLVFNRAIGIKGRRVCSWQTRDMEQIAMSEIHDQTKDTIRKLVRVFSHSGPLEIGNQVKLFCQQNFHADDHPKRIVAWRRRGVFA